MGKQYIHNLDYIAEGKGNVDEAHDYENDETGEHNEQTLRRDVAEQLWNSTREI